MGSHPASGGYKYRGLVLRDGLSWAVEPRKEEEEGVVLIRITECCFLTNSPNFTILQVPFWYAVAVYVILIMMSMVRKCRKGRAYKLNNCV
jgi:hypothetical protein